MDSSMQVTLAHVEQAVLWAKGKLKEVPDVLANTLYDQGQWAGATTNLARLDLIRIVVQEFDRDQIGVKEALTRVELALKNECGTACCIWGAAHLLATGKPANDSPGYEWTSQSDIHRRLYRESFICAYPQLAIKNAEAILRGIDV
jgi:hypothetical protein